MKDRVSTPPFDPAWADQKKLEAALRREYNRIGARAFVDAILPILEECGFLDDEPVLVPAHGFKSMRPTAADWKRLDELFKEHAVKAVAPHKEEPTPAGHST